MRFITCASYYGSGSSAITDFVSEFDSVYSFTDEEFRFVQDPDGVSDLEYNLVENFNRHNSGHAIKRYKKLVNFYCGNMFGKKYEKFFHGNWKKYSDGSCELFYDAGFSLNAGTAWCGGYYHKTTYGLVLPSWASNLRLVSATKADGTLAWCVGLALESDGYHFYWMTGSNASASGSNFMATHLTFTSSPRR